MVKQTFHDVYVFINGITSVCKDSAIIEEKTLAHFGNEYKRVVRYILMMKFQKFSAKQFAEALVPRDFLEGIYDVERECAKRMDVGQTKLLCLFCGVEGENEFFSRLEFCAMTHHCTK